MIEPDPLPKYNTVRDPRTLQKLCFQSEWVMQEKLDGVRLRCGIHFIDGVWARNNLHYVSVPDAVADFLESLNEREWLFDGELIGREYHIFDMIIAPHGRSMGRTFMERHMMLKAIVDHLGSPRINVVPLATSPSAKLVKILELRGNGAEGVVFHDNPSGLIRPNTDGRRVPMKFKFYQSADCVVIRKSIDGKRVCEIGVFDGVGGLVSVGKVKVEYKDIQRLKGLDPVIEVRYRQLSDARRLIEPVFQRIRTDKLAYNCTMDQLIAPRYASDSNSIPANVNPLSVGTDMTMTESKFLELFWNVT